MDEPNAIGDLTCPAAGPGVVAGAVAAGPAATAPSLAFAAVVPELRRFVWGVVRDDSLVDDVIQATYLKAIERGGAAQAETAQGWLFRVAYREALVARRREATRDRHTRRLATLPPRNDPRPDESLIRAETVQAVRRAMTELSEAQRRVVLARMHGEQTFAEIAAESGMPLGTVLTHMRRALAKMRQILDLGD